MYNAKEWYRCTVLQRGTGVQYYTVVKVLKRGTGAQYKRVVQMYRTTEW